MSTYWEFLWHSPESNITARAQPTILYNEFENYTFKSMPHVPGANELILWYKCFLYSRKLKHSFLPETDNSASRPRKQPIQLPKGDPESERPTASVRTQPPPREPSPEPVRQPSPEPVRQPSPEPVREPSPEPVREPSPEPVRSPAQPTSPAAIPQARNLMRDGLPPRQDSDEEQEDDQDWGGMHCWDMTWVSWHPKSLTAQLFVQQFVQANN